MPSLLVARTVATTAVFPQNGLSQFFGGNRNQFAGESGVDSRRGVGQAKLRGDGASDEPLTFAR